MVSSITLTLFKKKKKGKIITSLVSLITHIWHMCHSQRCFGTDGRKSAVPAFKILAVNRRSLLVSKCQFSDSFWILYACEATQFSSMAHCNQYNCLSSRWAVRISSMWSNTRSGMSRRQTTLPTFSTGPKSWGFSLGMNFEFFLYSYPFLFNHMHTLI